MPADSESPHRTRSRPPGGAVGLLLMLAAVGLLNGCAGMARGTSTPVYRAQEAPAPERALPDGPEALVVIRYPALIHADAEHSFYQAYGNQAIGDPVPLEVMLRTDMTRVAQAVIAKSNFFAMSLYRELRDTLPDHSVLLSPHMITWDRETGLGSRPMLASEQIPSVLTIDFNVYSYPDIREVMDAPPLTFGDLVTPLIVVHGDRWLRPATNGLVLSSEPLVQSAWALSRAAAEAERTAMVRYPPPAPPRSLDFTGFLQLRELNPVGVPRRAPGEIRPGEAAVEVYPLEKVQMDPLLVARLDETPGVDPFADRFVDGAANRIVRLLHEADIERALFLQRHAALLRFDPELANVYLAGSEDESVRARLQLAQALIRAEKVFLSDQSEKVFQGTYEGDYGQKMRQMIAAEYGMLEERRRLARIQNVTTALTIAMLAGSVYGTSVSGSAVASALQSVAPALVLGSVWTARSSLKTRARSANITEKYMALMAPELDQQIDVQMEWMESRERITARGFAEFRDKTTALYQSRVRSLQTTADEHCRFSHPEFQADGRWFGGCEDGRATGRGYGILSGSDGVVEYAGEARDGRAHGNGGMILVRPGSVGAVFFEGRFREGVPDGVVARHEPGQRPQWFSYAAGRETGRASEREWTRPLF
ncbi:hypothetical protein [Elongatibacter sediminis]|uniref:Uncharacterized protein n=1 Tax=Elongatibacter sediminis TaxID=3119006 RepID=A0AAW9R924_9GAMM